MYHPGSVINEKENRPRTVNSEISVFILRTRGLIVLSWYRLTSNFEAYKTKFAPIHRATIPPCFRTTRDMSEGGSCKLRPFPHLSRGIITRLVPHNSKLKDMSYPIRAPI